MLQNVEHLISLKLINITQEFGKRTFNYNLKTQVRWITMVLSSSSSFMSMQIPTQFISYLFLNGPTGRITAMCRQIMRCWSLCYGHSANSNYAHSSGVPTFNFPFRQWINIIVVDMYTYIHLIHIYIHTQTHYTQKECTGWKVLLKNIYITNCENSGSKRFNTLNSEKLHSMLGFFLFISPSTVWYSVNNDVLFLWCCNIKLLQYSAVLFGKTNKFPNTVIPKGK